MNSELLRPRQKLALMGLACVALAYGGYMAVMLADLPPRWIVVATLLIATLVGICGAGLLCAYAIQWVATIVSRSVSASRPAEQHVPQAPEVGGAPGKGESHVSVRPTTG